MLITLSVQVLLVWKSKPLRWSTIASLSFLAFALGILSLLDWRAALWLAAFFVAVCAGGAGVVLVGLNVFRLLDPNRRVLLSNDAEVCVDAVFRRRRSLSLRNHGRTFGAKSAPAMRQAVKDWVRPLIGSDFVIAAQNARVARMYQEQFPELHIVGRDWMGHPKLAVRPGITLVDANETPVP
ncbi:hypothetical protein [Microbacterium saperdae]|nr:hypothetical protein [Microbacterium saperdae]GGM42183.1 hypothetical protein GCM10010489_11590 [Microbacterium saperdae]